MPSPISLRLTARVRGLLPIIESGVASGLSSRSINEAIRRATGTGIRRQTLLDIRREILAIRRHGETLKFIRKDRIPDPFRVPNALTPIRRAFSSTIEVRGFLLGTGEKIVSNIQVTHDAPLRAGDIEDIAASFFEEGQEDQFDSTAGISLESVLLVRQVKRA